MTDEAIRYIHELPVEVNLESRGCTKVVYRWNENTTTNILQQLDRKTAKAYVRYLHPIAFGQGAVSALIKHCDGALLEELGGKPLCRLEATKMRTRVMRCLTGIDDNPALLFETTRQVWLSGFPLPIEISKNLAIMLTYDTKKGGIPYLFIESIERAYRIYR